MFSENYGTFWLFPCLNDTDETNGKFYYWLNNIFQGVFCLKPMKQIGNSIFTNFDFWHTLNQPWPTVRRLIQKCLKIARGCFFLPLFANPHTVLNFIPDLYPVVLNCFCLLFFIMVVTSAISVKLIVLWKLYPSSPFTMFTLFCRSHFIWLLSAAAQPTSLSFGVV